MEFNAPVFQRICPDKRGRVDVYIHGDIPAWPPKRGGQILRKDIFPRRLRPGKQQVLSAQYRRGRAFPHFPAVIHKPRSWDAFHSGLRRGMRRAEIAYLIYKRLVYPFRRKLTPYIHKNAIRYNKLRKLKIA